MRDDEPGQPDTERAGVIPVVPVVRGKGVLPRAVIVALAVGVLAFLAGVELGAGGTTDRTRATIPVPTSSPAPAATPSQVSRPPGSSEFVRTLRPPELIAGLPDGAGCVTHAGGATDYAGGPTRTFVGVWTAFCPLPAERRVSFVKAAVDAFSHQVPGYSYSVNSSDRGSTVALFPYTQGSFVGTVTLAADAARSGFEIMIPLEERLAP